MWEKARVWQKKKLNKPIQLSASIVPHQYLFHYFQITEMEVSHGPTLGTKGGTGEACCQIPPWHSVFKSRYLNHNYPKANTVNESIIKGELETPRDPGVSLIQTTNLPDSQIIGNLLDLVEKEIFTLIIHFVRGCISSPLREWDHTDAHERRENALLEWKWTSLANNLILRFFASSVLLFVSPSFFFSLSQCSYPFWSTGDSNPLSQILNLPCSLSVPRRSWK